MPVLSKAEPLLEYGLGLAPVGIRSLSGSNSSRLSLPSYLVYTANF